MKKQELLFLIIGMPTIIFFLFILSQSFVIIGSFMTVFLIVFIIGFCLHKKDLALNLTKLGILLFLLLFILYPNPLDWGNQINRRINKHQLITPNDPKIALLNQSFFVWYKDKNDTYFGSPTSTAFKDLDEVIQVKIVQFYLYNRSNPDRILHYSYDFFNPPRLAYDHLATVNEILNENATYGTDDCDGIAVVTCSLLTFMGYDAYIAEGDSHWWTVVFFNGSHDWSQGNPIQLNWWPSVGNAYFIFNRYYLIITQPIMYSIANVLSETGNYIYGDFYYDVLMGEYINPILAWVLVIIILLVLALLIQYFLIVPRRWKLKKSDLTGILFGWVMMTIVCIGLFLLVHFDLAIYAHLLVFSSLTIIIFCMDRKIPKKIPGFNKFS
ncbi:MAG: hypothetical protein ACTSPY_00735 [Candidatus Helarchaeota archaeon]